MEAGSKRKRAAGQWVAVLLVGMLAGSVMLTPAGAHIKNFNHMKKKHFYTKKAANKRFINVGEKASDADKLDGKDSTEFLGTAGKAADADKLDSLDSTAFQRSGCVDGNVLGYARILDASYGAAYSAVSESFSCVSGFTVLAKKTATGVYRIDFGFNGTLVIAPCGEHIPTATLENDVGEIIADSAAEASGIFLGQNCVVDVKTFLSDGMTAANRDFTVVVHRQA